MLIIKVIVLFCFILSGRSFRVRYCGLCNNHTLCKYPVKGPPTYKKNLLILCISVTFKLCLRSITVLVRVNQSPSYGHYVYKLVCKDDGRGPNCVSYDKMSPLTTKEAQDIMDRINERRHLVATGSLNRFPMAANMKKLKWSLKLASFAQRWADQCDYSVKPDREDECRDLANMEAGQNIATVLGPAPGLSVKSFVDIWFMLNLQFTGSVAYYNQSKDSKTNYFTQLIWAETASVGCGRAKFFNNKLYTTVERIICNFAPKGNVHGKPIYTIGYPGTQCPEQMNPDIKYPALCQQTTARGTNFTDKVSSPNSLLRILNLSNHSLKQELDPNNLRQIHLNSSKASNRRNQKTRNVYPNNSYGAIKRDSLHFQNSMPNVDNYNDQSQHTQRQFTQERGHSRMYHGHQTSKEPLFNLDFAHVHTETDFRRTYTTPSPKFYLSSIPDGRKYFTDSGCTRNMMHSEVHGCFSPEPPYKKTNECPRVQSHSCPQPNPCGHTALSRFDKLCPCNEPPPAPCSCNRNCQPTSNCPPFTTTYCPYRKAGGDEINKKFNQFENYDIFHNLEVKSGEEDSASKQPWRFENPNPINIDISDMSRESDEHRQVKVIIDESKARTPQDSYRSFGYSERKKRDIEDQTFKPFWQMDEYNQKKSPDLKYIKYTTLANKKLRKTRKTTSTSRSPTSTETITIKPKDKSTVYYNHRGRVTERYLSFDELMHLRKLSTAVPIESNARRQADDNLDLRTDTTTTITANTPYIRQKYCTRKLTCTWTGPIPGAGGQYLNSGNGSMNGPGGLDVGSRTPPGYVEGCTRTSTCTRIYMDRNKMATLSEAPIDGHTGITYQHSTVDSSDTEEDYCERRSLNIRRRNLNEKENGAIDLKSQDDKMEFPILTAKIDEVVVTSVQSKVGEIDSQTDTDNIHCICYEEASRVKRGDIDQFLIRDCNGNCNMKYINPPLNADHSTQVNVRSKNSIKSYQCPCNGTKSVKNMFYGTITLTYCVTWLFYHIFILRIYEG